MLAAVSILSASVAVRGAGAASGDPAAPARPGEEENAAAVPSTLAVRVRQRLAAGHWREALQLAADGVEARPRDAALRAAYGEALLRAGRPAEALAQLAPLAGSDGLDGRGAVTWARLLAAGVEPGAVESWLQRATAAAPDDPPVWYWAGELSPERGRAIERLERYLEIGVDEPEERRRAVEGALGVLREARRRDVRAWEVVARPRTVEVPLIPVRRAGLEGLAVDVRLGERRRSTRLLLDTGASGLFLVDRIARKRGLVALADRDLVGGGRGAVRSTSGTMPRFALGELAYAAPLAKTVVHALDPEGRYQGLVGLRPFAGYRVQVDVPGRRLRLDRVDGAEAEGASPAAGEARYWWFSGQLTVEVRVHGEPALFILDTGAATSALSMDLVGHLDGLREGEPVRLRRFGLEARGRRVRGVELEFLDGALSDARLPTVDLGTASRLGGVEVGGLLGLDLLGRGTLTLDTARRRVAFRAGQSGSSSSSSSSRRSK